MIRRIAAITGFILILTMACWAGGSSTGETHAAKQTPHHGSTNTEHHAETVHPATMTEHHGESAHADPHGEKEGNGVMEYLAHHLTDAETYDLPWGSVKLPVLPFNIPQLGYTHGVPITKHMLGLVVAGLLVIVLVIPGMARTRKGEIPTGFGNFLEVLVVFVRDDVVYPNMGEETGRKWMPVFLTGFFLVLFSNLLGMFPWGTTPTGNINVTGGLAITMLLMVFVGGFSKHGIKYIATLIPHGVPWPVVILLFPIEIFGLFVKHFALAIRLFANMLAGHTVIGVFLALILSPFVAIASVPGAVAISLLELFVAFLQSYIFVMLASLFVGSAIHPSH
ncbi:F0F1 ATP synthase subunit A [bacterium]|nr:F0F1 ATP synthase subunit A [bacterium]